MTKEEAIVRIENHMFIHKRKEPEAIYITEALNMAIEALEQESKTGHWIKYGKLYQCSECKELSCCQGKFCNECGAKMVEPQESEDKR